MPLTVTTLPVKKCSGNDRSHFQNTNINIKIVTHVISYVFNYFYAPYCILHIHRIHCSHYKNIQSLSNFVTYQVWLCFDNNYLSLGILCYYTL